MDDEKIALENLCCFSQIKTIEKQCGGETREKEMLSFVFSYVVQLL